MILPFEVLQSSRIIIASALLISATPSFALIGGTEAAPGAFPQAARVADDQGHFCSAVVIGPRILASANHCGAKLTRALVGGKEFLIDWLPSGFQGNDFALAITSTDMNVDPMSVGGNLFIGEEATLLGYGCRKPNEATDLVTTPLQIAPVLVTDVDFYTFETGPRPNQKGAASCGTDGGGPIVAMREGRPVVVGVQSRSDQVTMTYATKIDRRGSALFLMATAAERKLLICGLNAECGDGRPPRAITPITQFSVSGPYPCLRDKPVSECKYGPEMGPVNLAATYDADPGTKVGWATTTVDSNNLVNLQNLFKAEDHAAYGVVFITADRAQDASFFLNSDDSVEGWVNGEKHVSYTTSRGWEHIPNHFRAKLRTGVNELLIKIGNGGGAWMMKASLDTEFPVQISPVR